MFKDAAVLRIHTQNDSNVDLMSKMRANVFELVPMHVSYALMALILSFVLFYRIVFNSSVFTLLASIVPSTIAHYNMVQMILCVCKADAAQINRTFYQYLHQINEDDCILRLNTLLNSNIRFTQSLFS